MHTARLWGAPGASCRGARTGQRGRGRPGDAPLTGLSRSSPGGGDMRYGESIGRIALAAIFLFNGFGLVDQSMAARELAARGTPVALVPLLVMTGRLLQI